MPFCDCKRLILQNNAKGVFAMTYTWKVVYYLPADRWSGGNSRGVAFVEAATQPEASWAFHQQYAGEFSTIERIEKFC